MKNENRNKIDGTLLFFTRVQMWTQGLHLRFLISLIGGGVCATIFFRLYPPLPVDLNALSQGTIMNLKDALKLEAGKHGFTWFYPEQAKMVFALPDKYRQAGINYLMEARRAYWKQWVKYIYASVFGAILFYVVATILKRNEERWREEDQFIRGAQLASPKQLSKMVKQNSKEIGDLPPRLQIGGVLIPRRNEITPMSCLGRPQVGKSTLFKFLLDQIISKQLGKRVIFDSKGDYTQSHLQPGDQIFAPSVDTRSLKWTIFNDITSLSRISDVATALIPEGGKDPMWANGARLILEGLLLHCWIVNKKTNAYLWQVACQPADKLKEILAATPGAEMAAALLDKPEVTTSFSFTVNLKTFLKPLQLLARMDGPFSIREWLVDGKNDGLFVVSIPDHLEVLKPLMNLFLSTLLTAHKSLPDDRTRRVFYVLDELGVLPKVPGLSDALNFGPSKGLCCWLGYQSYQQIEELYGRNVLEAMVSSAGEHIAFSLGSERTLESISKLIGEAEVIESRATITTGPTDSRHGGSSMDQRVMRRLVKPDEIKDLPPLQAYIKILGYPAAKIKLDYIPYPKLAESNIPDPTFDLDTYLMELAQLRAQADAAVQTELKNEISKDQAEKDSSNIENQILVLEV